MSTLDKTVVIITAVGQVSDAPKNKSGKVHGKRLRNICEQAVTALVEAGEEEALARAEILVLFSRMHVMA